MGWILIFSLSFLFLGCEDIETQLGIEKNNEKTLSWFEPKEGDSWFMQMEGSTIRKDVEIHFLNLFNISEATIVSLQKSGSKVICQFSAGVYDNKNSYDNRLFPKMAVGNLVSANNLGRYWIDINNKDIQSIMEKRVVFASEKGCDGISITDSNLDRKITGFYTSYLDQIDFNKNLIEIAHQNELSIGFKNVLYQIRDISENIDFVTSENCYLLDECYQYEQFTKLDKPLFNIEFNIDNLYEDKVKLENLCLTSKAYNVETILFDDILDGTYKYSCENNF